MIKNVTVLDMQGNMIGTTYPKRAKGLVKSGRACFVDGETVQLACPPGKSMPKWQEGMSMEMTLNREADNRMPEITKQEVKNGILQEAEDTLADVMAEQEVSKTESTDVWKKETAKKETEDVSEKAKKIMDAGISLMDILHNLMAIHNDNDYINKALDNLEKMPTSGGTPDLAGQARAGAVADIVKCRETTNQMMINFYTQIYTDYMEK